jgi:hypothetical protein
MLNRQSEKPLVAKLFLLTSKPVNYRSKSHLLINGLNDIVTDEQLFIALSASLPLWHPPSVPSLVHELKLWGKDCVFAKEHVGGEGRTGKMMIETLLSDLLCAERTVTGLLQIL